MSNRRAASVVVHEQEDSCATGVQTGTASARPTRAGDLAHAADPTPIKRQAVLLAAGCVAALSLCAVLWSSTRSAAATLDLRRSRADTLAADARLIARLRQRPQQATETGLRRSDLLERVSRAMQAATLDPTTLVSTLPQPPRRLPNSEHAEVAHRLMFQAVGLEGLARFCHILARDNSELRIAGLHLRAASGPAAWNADVSVSYWILAPQRKRGARPPQSPPAAAAGNP